jgi:plastocyanin
MPACYRLLLFFLLIFVKTAAQTDTTIALKAITGLQYDLPRFAVKPGSRVTIIFKNDDDMAHNVIFTRPGKRVTVVEAAQKMGDQAQALHYVPKTPDVVAASKILMPNASEILTFTAANQEGIYPYVCSYPGHGYIMYGAMYVTTKALPPLSTDPHVSPVKQAEAMHHQHEASSPHPFALEYPLVYRTFMPDCGPAAIAVALTPSHSYCFDAGKCYLRYAWTGGFVDNSAHWKGNGNALAKLQGTVYFKDQTGFPLRVGKADKLPDVKFGGYQLRKRIPTFTYLTDGIAVSETLKELPREAGLQRTFRFAKPTTQPIWFVTESDDGITYRASVGQWKSGVLTIPKGCTQVVITMKKNS